MAIHWLTPINVSPGATGWQDVDLSAHIPEGASAAILEMYHPGTSLARLVCARANGSTDSRLSNSSSQSQYWTAVKLDANRIAEINLSSVSNCFVYLVGYCLDDIVMFVNGVDISLTNTGVWEDIDISALTGADTAIGAIVERTQTDTALTGWGIRKNGSTDARTTRSTYRATAFIGVDASEVLEGYTDGTNIKFHLLGYFLKHVTFNTNASDISLTNTSSWRDLAAFPAGATGGIIEMIGVGAYLCGLRVNGGSTDLRGGGPGGGHAWGLVDGDTNRIAEGYISTSSVDFYLVGYSELEPTPTIANLSASHGKVGDSVTITGTGFGANQGSGSVKFNGTSATITSWSDTEIVCTVPAGATTGQVVVTNDYGNASAGELFTLDPVISAATPNTGAEGDSVTITGTGFGNDTGTVTVGGVAATVTSWTDTEIVITVPAGVTAGATTIVVTNDSAIASDGLAFTVTSASDPTAWPAHPVYRAYRINSGAIPDVTGARIIRGKVIGNGDADAFFGAPIVRVVDIGSGPLNAHYGAEMARIYVVGEGDSEGYKGHETVGLFTVT